MRTETIGTQAGGQKPPHVRFSAAHGTNRDDPIPRDQEPLPISSPSQIVLILAAHYLWRQEDQKLGLGIAVGLTLEEPAQ